MKNISKIKIVGLMFMGLGGFLISVELIPETLSFWALLPPAILLSGFAPFFVWSYVNRKSQKNV